MPTGDLLAVAHFVSDVAGAFVVAGEHAAEHDEIRAGAVGLGDVPGHGAAAVGADPTFQAVRGVGAFDDGGELRIADAGHPPGGAHRPRPDADLDDVGAGDHQRLGHVAGDHVARHDDGLGMLVADALDDVEELLGVAVGDVEADEPDPRPLRHRRELLQVGGGRSERIEGVGAVRPGEEPDQFVLRIVLVQGGQRPMFTQRPGHLHRPGDVHVGGDERKTLPLRAGVDETEQPG